jgi:signal transduction histidine kinase
VHLEFAVDSTVQGPVASTAYFVLAEAVTNALRHANPTALTIRLATEDDRVTVEVADDGSGGAVMNSGHGLRGMADRVEALGGSLVIDSSPGRGTRLIASLPRADVTSPPEALSCES